MYLIKWTDIIKYEAVRRLAMFAAIEDSMARVAERFADLWLTYWRRHGDDDAYSRPHWC